MKTQHPTLLTRLNDEYPEWALEYGNDPLVAALELGLVSCLDVAAAHTVLAFDDEPANWDRVEQWFNEYHT